MRTANVKQQPRAPQSCIEIGGPGCPAMNIHLFRDVWASEYLSSTTGLQDVITAAAVLGDDVDTVQDSYADLQKFNAGVRADRRFLRMANGKKRRTAKHSSKRG